MQYLLGISYFLGCTGILPSLAKSRRMGLSRVTKNLNQVTWKIVFNSISFIYCYRTKERKNNLLRKVKFFIWNNYGRR